MAEQAAESIPGLIRGVVNDARELIREEIALAKSELREEISAARTVATTFAAAALLALIGIVLFSIALGGAIADLFNTPAWVGYGIVAVLLGAGAYLLVSRATTALGKIRALPKTQESLRENIAWMQSRSSSR
jgi:hypothetical protein